MREMWDLYDVKGNQLGRLHERGLPLIEEEYHLVVEVCIVNNNNEMLMTQRNPNKTWGGYWECTIGAVIAGENAITGARREVSEAVGIEITEEHITYLGTKRYRGWFVDSFLARVDLPKSCIPIQSSEFIDTKWVDRKELETMCTQGTIVPFAKERLHLYRNVIMS